MSVRHSVTESHCRIFYQKFGEDTCWLMTYHRQGRITIELNLSGMMSLLRQLLRLLRGWVPVSEAEVWTRNRLKEVWTPPTRTLNRGFVELQRRITRIKKTFVKNIPATLFTSSLTSCFYVTQPHSPTMRSKDTH
eukprot:scaffold102385_cov55-Cyclotella_meneghiniana.AAC.2